MPGGVLLIPRSDAANLIDDVLDQARLAHELGVKKVWLAQQLNYDAISLAGLVGAAVPGLGVGTSVVPINPRHPLIVAQLAQTAQAATHGNFSLGLGLGARIVERPAFGNDWNNVIIRLREHLTILRSVFDTGMAGPRTIGQSRGRRQHCRIGRDRIRASGCAPVEFVSECGRHRTDAQPTGAGGFGRPRSVVEISRSSVSDCVAWRITWRGTRGTRPRESCWTERP